ncbi:lipoprotein LpqH [Gordonia rubripertincta]|uniref:lipoprotein LpqH n=1 Tax=Gordonia rubripertincta TaxID=36822 RepID=UPI0013C2B765
MTTSAFTDKTRPTAGLGSVWISNQATPSNSTTCRSASTGSTQYGKGSATVTEDGPRITIRGTAESYDLTPPVTKRYEIAVTCD